MRNKNKLNIGCCVMCVTL